MTILENIDKGQSIKDVEIFFGEGDLTL